MFDNGMLKVQEYCKRMTTRLVACRAARRTGRERVPTTIYVPKRLDL
jgi:hypothetical protein